MVKRYGLPGLESPARQFQISLQRPDLVVASWGNVREGFEVTYDDRGNLYCRRNSLSSAYIKSLLPFDEKQVKRSGKPQDLQNCRNHVMSLLWHLNEFAQRGIGPETSNLLRKVTNAVGFEQPFPESEQDWEFRSDSRLYLTKDQGLETNLERTARIKAGEQLGRTYSPLMQVWATAAYSN